jgi:hypothetical protein
MYNEIRVFVFAGLATLIIGSCGESDPKPDEKEIVAHVETYAGSIMGFEDGPLLTAKFDWPSQIIRSSSGNFYVLDQEDTAVRKITPDGMVTTLFSNRSLYSIAVDADEVLYVNAGTEILKVIDGSAETVASGADYGDERYFSGIWGMSFHPDGYLYACESSNARIMKISKEGTVSVYAGGEAGYVDGNLVDARFGDRQGMLITSNGDFYLADFNNTKFRKISGGKVTTIAGTTLGYLDGPALEARFGNPLYFARSTDGTIFFTGTEHLIRKISADGVVSTIAGSQPGYQDAIGRSAKFGSPSGLALDSDENLYVVDSHNNRIRKIVFKLE